MDHEDEIPSPAAANNARLRTEELEVQLQRSLQQQASLERELYDARREISAHVQFEQQIFNSRSWRITAPLRGFKSMLGAPPAATAPLPLNIDISRFEFKAPPLEWDSLIPREFPAAFRNQSPDQAGKRNEICEIVRPDAMLDGLLPAVLLGGVAAAGAATAGLIRHGDHATAVVAFVGSEELANELAFDAAVLPLSEAGWESELAAHEVELLLVEPVWHVGNQDWRNALHAEGRGRARFQSLLKAAKDRGIPITVWFRMPPSDIRHFAWLAEHADAFYAIDEPSARGLSKMLGREVPILAPAVQPMMHNPFRTWEGLAAPEFGNRALFDGWFDLQDGAADDPLIRALKRDHLLVCESEWQFGGLRLADSPEFKRNALGCLSTAGKIAMAKMAGVEVFRRSPLIPDWRRELMMLRSAACGPVVAGPRDASMWGELSLRGEPEALSAQVTKLLADPLARARLSQTAVREILSRHCLADRLNKIAGDLGLPLLFGRKPTKIAALLVTMRQQLLAGCIERFRADHYPHKELVVVLHGAGVSLDDARALIQPGENISIYQLGKELSLGACLNFAAAQSDAEYWAKFDDDDFYGPNYLSDIMLYRRAIDFPVGGKPAAFIYCEASDEFRWDERYAVTRARQYRRAGRNERIHIAGGTLVGKREVLESVPFSVTRRRGSDSDFLKRTEAAGLDFLAFDFFNFALFRSGKPGFHTWNADMDEFKQRTIHVGSAADVHETVFL